MVAVFSVVCFLIWVAFRAAEHIKSKGQVRCLFPAVVFATVLGLVAFSVFYCGDTLSAHSPQLLILSGLAVFDILLDAAPEIHNKLFSNN